MFMKTRLCLFVILGCFMAPALHAQPYAFDDGRGIPTIAPVVSQITKAVVNIAVISEQAPSFSPLFSDPFFREFFDFPMEMEPRPRVSAGTGVIIDAQDGIVLTNTHVVAAGEEISVTLTDGRQFEATVLGSDPATDIAVLQIDADDLTALPLGDSDQLLIGDFVIAVGNPFGIGQTVTTGIVSALGRSGINPEGYEDFIQTDASINPGNSGGALVTLDGKLVGINTAIIAPSGGNVGIGFAVPINMAKSVQDQLLEFGEVRRGRLGVIIQDLTPDLREALGVDAAQGAIVVEVEPDSAAADVGLQPGDIVLSVDGEMIEGSGDMRNRIGMLSPGQTIDMMIMRDNAEIALSVTLGSSEPSQGDGPRTNREAIEGAELSDLSSGMPGYGEVKGVAVISVSPGTAASRAGLRAWDIITRVNNRPVETVAQLQAEIADQRPGPVALGVYRDGGAFYAVLR
jgi:Do/DeqQ family serine protease